MRDGEIMMRIIINNNDNRSYDFEKIDTRRPVNVPK